RVGLGGRNPAFPDPERGDEDDGRKPAAHEDETFVCRDRREKEDDEVKSAEHCEPPEIPWPRRVARDDLKPKGQRPEPGEPESREAAGISRGEVVRRDALFDRDGGKSSVRRREKAVPDSERREPPARIAANSRGRRRRRDRRRESRARNEGPRESRRLRVLRMIPHESQKHDRIDERERGDEICLESRSP